MQSNRLVVLSAGNFLVATSFMSVGGLLNEISASLHIPIQQAGLLISGVGGSIGNVLSVRMVRRVGAAGVAYKCNMTSAAMLLLWPFFASWLAAIFVVQFLWSLGSAGFPAVQQARLVAVAPQLAAATIALVSSVTYLGGSIGATIGASAWTPIAPRYMPWVGFFFILAALACSVRGERTARQASATAGASSG